MRKWVLVGLFLVAGLAFAATPGKILIWADDTRAPVFREIGKAYTEKTGIPIEVVEIGFGQIRDQFVTAAPTGEGRTSSSVPTTGLGNSRPAAFLRRSSSRRNLRPVRSREP